jgi:hypothetical protein
VFVLHKLGEAKKKNSSSGKIQVRNHNRSPSGSKRTEESLEKE